MGCGVIGARGVGSLRRGVVGEEGVVQRVRGRDTRTRVGV